MNTVIDLIKNRASCPKLTGAGLTPSQIEQVMACAVRAPDHGRLKPWHFHLVQGDARIKLGHIFAQSAALKGSAPDSKISKCRNMPLRAPMLIVAVCEPVENAKVPVMEQVLAVGAAIQNMQIAISSLGLGSIWRTGEMVESDLVKDAFNVSKKGSIVGFVYVGQPEKAPTTQQPNIHEYFTHWEGE